MKKYLKLYKFDMMTIVFSILTNTIDSIIAIKILLN